MISTDLHAFDSRSVRGGDDASSVIGTAYSQADRLMNMVGGGQDRTGLEYLNPGMSYRRMGGEEDDTRSQLSSSITDF